MPKTGALLFSFQTCHRTLKPRRCSVGARCRSCHRSPARIHGPRPPVLRVEWDIFLIVARTHLHRCRTFVPAQMCTRRSRPSRLNPLMIKIGPHIFLNRVPFDGARRGPWACTGGGRASRVCTRDRVAGAGYACSARPDLHTVCRSFHKISSALSAKVRGGSRSEKILIQSRGDPAMAKRLKVRGVRRCIT